MERIVFDQMKAMPLHHMTMNVHLQAYWFAHKFVYNKRVIDAACGTCFGTMIYSTGAKKIYAVDKSKPAMDYGKKRLKFFCPVEFIVADLETDVKLPTADICVSVETIEHLENNKFLKGLKTRELFYTVPINMKVEDENTYHKLCFKTPEAAMQYIDDAGWNTLMHWQGENSMLLGIAERKKKYA